MLGPTVHLHCIYSMSVIEFHCDLGLADQGGCILHLILAQVCRSTTDNDISIAVNVPVCVYGHTMRFVLLNNKLMT